MRTVRWYRHAFLVAAATLGASACGAETAREGEAPAGAAAEPSVTDSAGIVLATVPLEALPVRRAIPTDFRLSSTTGGGEAELHRVRNPFLGDEGLVVPDAGSHRVVIYDRKGSPLRTLGAEGDAPGEYRSIAWVRPYRGDSLAVWDGRLLRLTVVDRDGETVRTVRPASGSAGAPGVSRGVGVSVAAPGADLVRATDVFPDGDMLGRVGDVSAGPGDTTAVRSDTVRWARYGPGGEHVRDLVRLPDDEHFVWAEGGSRSVGPLPFGRTTGIAALGQGLVVADNSALGVVVHDSTGAPVRVGRVEVDAPRITEADIADWTASRLENLSGPFAESGRRRIEATPFPERGPFHGELVVTEGGIWLERWRKPGAPEDPEWIAFDRDGMPRARVRLPPRSRVTDVRGDTVVAVQLDPLDVERVVLLTLGAPERGR